MFGQSDFHYACSLALNTYLSFIEFHCHCTRAEGLHTHPSLSVTIVGFRVAHCAANTGLPVRHSMYGTHSNTIIRHSGLLLRYVVPWFALQYSNSHLTIESYEQSCQTFFIVETSIRTYLMTLIVRFINCVFNIEKIICNLFA